MQLKSLLSESRLDYIAKKQGGALIKAYSQDKGPSKPKNLRKPESVLNALANADPSPNHRYLQWLANRYIHNDFSLEDLDRVNADLNDFLRVRNRLSVRDINAYSVDELYKVMEPLLSVGQQASMKRKQPWKASEGEQKMFDAGHARLLYHDDQIRVFVPDTFEASCHFGTGTKWCTTWTDSPNHFTRYKNQGPLYIVDTPDGKFQFHFETNSFNNDKDRPAELGALVDRYPQLERVFKQLADQHGILGLLKNPTHEAMVNSVTRRPDSIRQLRITHLTPEIVQKTMDNVDSYHVDDVFSFIMKFRPDLVTKHIKHLAIKAKPSTIKSIPPDELTAPQVEAAMNGKNATDVVETFRWLEASRPELVTDDVRVQVLQKDGRVIETIKNPTQTMVEAAMSDLNTTNAIKAFKWIMEHELSSKVSDEAFEKIVGRSRHALKFIPEHRQTDEIISKALEHDVGAFSHVKRVTPEIIAKAVSEGAFIIKDNKYIRDKIDTALMVRAAKMNPEAMAHELGGSYDVYDVVPPYVDLNKVLAAAMRENGLALEHIKHEKQTPEIIKAAVRSNSEAWKFANKHLIAKDPVLRDLMKEYQRGI